MASKTLVVIAALAVVIILIAGVFLYMGKGATVIWASTQLNPAQEQAFVKEELLPPFTQETGIEVQFVAISYSDLATRLEADMQAGKVTIDLIGDLHGALIYSLQRGGLRT